MTVKKWIQLVLIIISAFALASCYAKRKTDDSAINDANSAYDGSAQSSGLGEESSFGDQAGGRMHASSKNVYYFDFDSDAVRDSDKPAISSNASRLASRSSNKVMLEGHTDPRGSREYNIGLGERRAKGVAEVMTNNGASPTQIRVVSYGAEKLATPGHTESDYQLDRRVALVYVQR